MLDVLRNQLPAGLSKFAVVGGDQMWTQRPQYPFVQRAKCITQKQVQAPIVSQNVRKIGISESVVIVSKLIREIDELYDIYNDQLKAETNQRFLSRVKDFVGKTPGRELVGKKSSREILAFASAPHMYPLPPISFFKLCSFLLNAKLCYKDAEYVWTGNDIDIVKTIHL